MTPSRVARLVPLGVCVAGLIAAGGAGIDATARQTPQFRASVDLVHLDVSVLDRDRKPARGLRAEDFTIVENGRPQTVSTFAAVDLPDPEPVTTTWMREIAPDVRTNEEVTDRRLLVLVMDDATIPFDPVMVKSARQIARTAIERLGPNDLAAVVFTRDNRNAQDFTSDRARLLAAVERFEAGSRTVGLPRDGAMLAIAEEPLFLSSVGTLASAADQLAAIPQRRKALVYVSVGVPVDLETAAAPAVPGISGAGGGSIALAGMHSRLIDRLNNVFRKAQLANVNIYPVDPAGLGGMEAHIEAQRFMGRAVPAYERANNYLDFLESVAENTGGQAFTNTNEFETGIEQIFAENGSYYLLGFYPTDARSDGRYRRLEVRVNRPGLTVRSRSGYSATRAAEPDGGADAPPSPLALAVAGLLPKADVPLQLVAAPFAVSGRREAGIALVLSVRQPMPARTGRQVEDVDLRIDAFSPEGQPRGSERLKTQVVLRPGGAEDVTFEVLSRLDLRPGRYQLRVAAHIGAQARTGSIYYDLDVPDFEKAPLAISGLTLGVEPSGPASPADRLKALVPVVPTARREFYFSDRVTAFARVYQGGKGPMTAARALARVTDDRGRVVHEREFALPAAVFSAGRAADVLWPLPLETLASGQYLLTLEAGEGRTAVRRDVRMTVR